MNRIRLVPLVAPRGNIYDRFGSLLAGSRVAFDCAIIPQEFKGDRGKLEQLSSLLQVPFNSLERIIKESVYAPFMPLVLKKDISKETAIAISERNADFPGVIIQTHPTRFYPNGNIGSHVAGYLGKITEGELIALSDYGYEVMDFVGRGGLELFYDEYLRGESGGMQIEVDSKGRELRVLGIKEPERGKDIAITIDIELERYADSLLEGYKGAIVIMDSNTGEILSFVSKPDFDPNVFVSSTSPAVIKSLLRRSDYPLVNRAITGTYPPGSAFKVVAASAALESKKIDAREKLDCQGFYDVGHRRFNCWKKKGHMSQTISDGIKNSCNVFFYNLGRRVGVDILSDHAFFYGFGNSSGIDLPYEARGVVPNRTWKKRHKKEAWYEGDTVNYAIGQGYLLVTPIQILRMINVIATEGDLVKPFLVMRIDSVEIFSVDKKHLNIQEAAFKIIKEGTKRAVEDEDGTARHVAVNGLEISGKTGTAETGEENTHAWFAGFSPIEKPKISLVIFLEHGGKGGDDPSKIAAKIFAKLRELEYL